MVKVSELTAKTFFLFHGELYAVISVGSYKVQAILLANVYGAYVNGPMLWFKADDLVNRVEFTPIP